MIPVRKDDVFDIVSIQQMLYSYSAELDSGARRVQEYFTDGCTFKVGDSVWKGRAGVRQHYDDDAKAVEALCKGGVKTVRHAMLNLRIDIRENGSAVVDLIFLNFSAAGTGPFLNAASPSVVADTRLICQRDEDGGWLIEEFDATPVFYGNDPYMNTVLQQM